MKPASPKQTKRSAPAPRPSDGCGRSLGANGTPSRIKGEGAVSAAPPIFFPAGVVPQGDGTFLVAPRKAVVGVQEINTTEAAHLLGYKSRASIHEEVLPHPLAKKFLRYRKTKGGGKILFDKTSVLAFRAATSKGGVQ